MESIANAILGIVCIIIGIGQRKGNLSLLHSYHRNNVAEEDKIPFGKLAGAGIIVVGATLIVSSAMQYAADLLKLALLATASSIVLAVGLVIGILICLYAIKKYNHRIF